MEIGAGTRALVTGASRGIGRALAEALAARGARVGLLARSVRELEALAAALPGEHVVLACDVGDAGAVRQATETFVTRTGGLDLLVACAGVAHHRPVRSQPLAEVEEMTRVNWLGTVHTVSAGLPYLLDRARGQVVIVSSASSYRSFPWAAAYAATKGAGRLYGEALRHELSGTGVSVTVVNPGEVATGLHDHERGRMPDWWRGGAGARPASALAGAILTAVERDARSLDWPRSVRALSAVQGVSPRVADAMLRRLRGAGAAPRRAQDRS